MTKVAIFSTNAVKFQLKSISTNDSQLFLVSFLALYLELSAIRWLGSHILYLSYFSNFVLLGAFFGLGVGALLAKRAVNLFEFTPIALSLLIAIALGTEVEVHIDSPAAIYFGAGRGSVILPDTVVLSLAFVLVAMVFGCIGQLLGRGLVGASNPLKGYTINILGSLLGIALFTFCSWQNIPAVVWFGISSLLIIALLKKGRFRILSTVLVLLTTASVGFAEAEDHWSPYYRWRVISEGESVTTCSLDYCLRDGAPIAISSPHYRLKVNSITHQHITDFRQREPFYEFPYLALGRRPERTLIIGAGNGTDTAFALAYQSKAVDAVEIDPDFVALGRHIHPNKVFQDPRVQVFIDDGRAFLDKTHNKYDLIIFGLPDSLTLASNHTSLRLESYLFTEQAFAAAKEKLSPNGLLVLYNYYREEWLVEKLGAMLRRVFDTEPRVLLGPDRIRSAVLFAGSSASKIPPPLGKDWGFRPVTPSDTYTSATDEWPFLYLKAPSIPKLYRRSIPVVAIFIIIVLVLVSGRGAIRRPDLPFFFMGSAFLLLETISVIRFALLFGSTWITNAAVFSIILLMVLAANIICMRFEIRRYWWIGLLLFVSIIVQYAVPLSVFLPLSPLLRYLAAGLLTFSPVFFANLIYARLFRGTSAADIAYAWNLLGAMVGGMLEYLAMLFGYPPLLIGVGVLYAASFLSVYVKSHRATVE